MVKTVDEYIENYSYSDGGRYFIKLTVDDGLFMDRLHMISGKSLVARKLISFINDGVETVHLEKKSFATLLSFSKDEAGAISYVNLNKDYNPDAPRKWCKAGRILGKILSVDGIKHHGILDKDIEIFVNLWTAPNVDNEEFAVVDDKAGFRDSYYEINYYRNWRGENKGSLWHSCMRYEACLKFLSLYTDHLKYCKMLVLSKDKKIAARALLWEFDDFVTGEHVKFMDRIYYYEDFHVNKMIDWAKDNGFLWKIRQTFNDDRLTDGVNIYDNTYTLKLFQTDYKHYPYLDTMKFIDMNKKILTNKPFGVICNKLQRADGGYLNSYYDGYNKIYINDGEQVPVVLSNGEDGYITKNDACYLKYSDTYTYPSEVNYSSIDGTYIFKKDAVYDKMRNDYYLKQHAIKSDHFDSYVHKSHAVTVDGVGVVDVNSTVLSRTEGKRILIENAVEVKLVDGWDFVLRDNAVKLGNFFYHVNDVVTVKDGIQAFKGHVKYRSIKDEYLQLYQPDYHLNWNEVDPRKFKEHSLRQIFFPKKRVVAANDSKKTSSSKPSLKISSEQVRWDNPVPVDDRDR